MADTRLKERSLFDPEIMRPAIWESFRKLVPQHVIKNPVMFVVEIGSVLTTLILVRDLFAPTPGSQPLWFTFNVSFWLWFTVVFANFAEAVAEGRGKAQAATLAQDAQGNQRAALGQRQREEKVPASALRKGDTVVVEAGEMIPGDGDVIQGIASVDESAITGESAPVIRESGGDRSAVTGGTKVLSDRIVVRITASPGESFLDRMIALVEGAERQKTPNEIALNILLAGLTLVFLFACVTLVPMALYSGMATVSVTVIVALLVCLIPTTIGGLAFGHRHRRHRSFAAQERACHERARRRGRGRRRHSAVGQDWHDHARQSHGDRIHYRSTASAPKTLADAAQLSSLADETPEGRSIVVLAKEKYGLRGREVTEIGAQFIPFSAETRMSGCDLDGRRIRKGAVDAIVSYVQEIGGTVELASRRHYPWHRRHRRHAAGGCRRQQGPRRHPS